MVETSRPDPAPGGEPTREEGWLAPPGRPRLFWQSWTPPHPRAVLALVHGLAEHSGRYDHVARHLVERGFAVIGIDCRGHGRSEGLRVHVGSFDELVDDAAALVALAAERYPALPRFVLGHSQGGLVVLLFLLRATGGLEGAVVTSPLLGVHPAAQPGRLKGALARLLERVAPALLVPNALDVRSLSHDPAVGQAYARDPLVSHSVSAGWLAALRRALAEAHAGAARIAVPVLVMSSGADQLVDPAATAAWAAAAPAHLVDYVRWDGLFHEMLNEPPELRAPVMARLDAWLDARRARLPD